MGEGEAAQPMYRRIVKLAHSGIGEVFLAVARGGGGFGKLVVLKELDEDLTQDPEALSIFLDEARLAAKLQHPNIVQTSEVGLEGNRYFIAMEYLEGQPLRRIFARCGPMPLAMYVHCLVRVLDGLHYAHELKGFDGKPLDIVHRDISPDNVFVTYHGVVKIVDSGLAKAKGAAHSTRMGTIRGRTEYMAPEQTMGKYDRRTDLFAVGIMLWEAVAGRQMWRDTSDLDIIHALSTGTIPSIREVKPDVDDALASVLARALATAPAERFATAMEMAKELEDYLLKSGAKVTARDLGAFVARGFEEERSTMQGLIEAQMGDSALPPTRLSQFDDGLVSEPRRTQHVVEVAASTRPASAEVASKKVPSRWARPAMLFVAVALLVVVVLLLSR